MKRFTITRRQIAVAGLATLLGACSIIPRGPEPVSRPVETPTPMPSATALPEDATHHRIALLVPL
jgi:branched-chain amino acid transport system substrate-binding protein